MLPLFYSLFNLFLLKILMCLRIILRKNFKKQIVIAVKFQVTYLIAEIIFFFIGSNGIVYNRIEQ